MTNEKIRELLNTGKTPAYVFDLNVLRERITFIRRHLPEEVKLAFAVKANTFIANEAAKCLAFLEICSPGEYEICEKEGIPHIQYVVSGVNKDPEFIEKSIASDPPAAYYTAESRSQFFLLRDTAEKLGKKISVLLRLTSGNQFGLDEKDLKEIVSGYQNDPNVDICGIQFFSGTQKNSLKKLKRELDYCDDFMTALSEEFGFTCRTFEYGTGFPVAYFEGETFEEEAFFASFSELLTGMRFSGNITLEIGRSIAASCGTYLTKVVDTKTNKGENYAIVDGGMHQIVYYGQFMAMKHPKIRVLKKGADGSYASVSSTGAADSAATDGASEPEDWNICGSLCTINDFLVKKLPVPGLSEGDVLVFENAGAYCPTEGIALFLSRELPRVILLDCDGNASVAREHIETAQFNMPGGIEKFRRET